MPRTRAVLLLPALGLAAALTLAACGSSTGAGASVSDTPPTTAAASPTATPPALVAAAAVPAVTGAQGAEPTIAKATAPAPTTLLAHDVIVGTGPAATTGDMATVNYTLELYAGGTILQSSYGSGGGAFTFTLGQGVITGFSEGTVGMQAGGRRELVIPPDLAYGATPPSGIPANATLIFVIDMVSFTPAS